jgi:CRISPR/Cas system-associated exonuclease Cas4 (RecB family)
VYKALEKEGEDAIQKRIDEFNVYDNYRHWNWKPGIQDTAYSIRQSFSTLLTKSDEEIDEIYERERKSLEEPDGRQFFGDVLVDAEHEAFVNGFFAARNWTTEEWLSDKLKLTAKIIDKLTAAQKRYHENTPR